MLKVAVIGTKGIPANYGGFETLLENLSVFHSENHRNEIQFTVYCSTSKKTVHEKRYLNTNLVHLNIKANGYQSILYDIYSITHAVLNKNKAILILGVSGSPILPIIRLLNPFLKFKLICNIDGLEWKRQKWGCLAKKYLKIAERYAVKYCDALIADNEAIQEYIQEEYRKESILIKYGGDHILKSKIDLHKKPFHTSSYNSFALKICRIEPENNIELVLKTFKALETNILIVGNWNDSDYGRRLKKEFGDVRNIDLLDPIYDQNELNILRRNCDIYIHGHSAGGTNPSLVEAMFLKKPIVAYDCVYNRNTTANLAKYFIDSFTLEHQIKDIFENLEINRKNVEIIFDIAKKHYTWEIISNQYFSLIKNLSA